MKLNMGSGQNRLPTEEGWTNCDIDPEAKPDVVMDMEQRWPFEDSSVEEIRCNHVLEHIGAQLAGYRTCWQEIYRVLKPGGTVTVTVPHPRHEHFIGDPTHVRAITPLQFTLFSRKNCELWRERNDANSPLALYWGIDFEMKSIELIPAQRWAQIRGPAQQTAAQLAEDADLFLGVCQEVKCVLKAVKS